MLHFTCIFTLNADKNKKWTLKDEMSVVLMLAMRATGSQRTLKHFRQYFGHKT